MQPLKQQLDALTVQLKDILLMDRMTCDREIRALRRSLGEANTHRQVQSRVDRLARRMAASARISGQRRESAPRLQFDPDLPITAKKDELIRAIQDHPVVIVAGETGSGKTTQLPKFCLAAGLGVRGRIGVTQPRRIAAVTVGLRIAEELGETIGQTASYKIRFKDTTTDRTRIKVMTDGVLLAEAHQDPFLNQYDTIIVDEAHERSLNIDFILGLLKQKQRRRGDLKVIITSATIDTEKFSQAFGGAPVVEVSGRMYPVETRYFEGPQENGEETSFVDLAAQAVDRLWHEKRDGDCLVFMPTEQDIRDTCELLEGRRYPATRVIPLFARLSAAEQQKVFQPHPDRKIVVATNVAETSLTIPGIRYVVDTGLARILQYVPRSRTTTLPVVPVSQSSADQRKGRCGRVAEGVCVRLFNEDDYNNRPRFTAPEILRSNLAEVILRMLALKLGEVESFPFIDPPAARSIQDGYSLLTELGAIVPAAQARAGGGRYNLTAKGRLMAHLPLDPRLACMLLEARSRGCLDDVAVICAALSIQDPRERPVEKQAEADQAHARFADPSSDFIALLRIWHAYLKVFKARESWSQVKKFCRANYLSFRRMREWQDIHQQILAVLAEHDIRPQESSKEPIAGLDAGDSWYAALHESILSGFLSNIAVKKEKQIFQAAHNRQAMIFPGSGLFKNPGEWIVAAEMVETSRLFARCAAVIRPQWVEALAGRQCRTSYSDPHWERKRGEVVATEQVSLYGLVLARRPKPYGPVHPAEASEIFIRQALIEGDVRQPLAFMQHNRALVERVADMENRLRRRDLLVEEQAMLSFYQQRLGAICDLRSLQKLIRSAGGDDFLRMRPEDLMQYRPEEEILALYPDAIDIQRQPIACEYRFDPGREVDGVTARVPAALAGYVPADAFQWLVPGLLADKITALIKGLAKEWRKQLVPVADTVASIIREMPAQPHTSLANALSAFIRRRFGIDIPPAAWDESVLPDYLRMRIALTDSRGKVVKTSRDPAIIREAAAELNVPQDFEAARKRYERDDIQAWDFGDLPELITLSGPGGRRWEACPALEVRAERVALTVFADLAQARKAHPQGVKALSMRYFSADIKYLRKNLQLPQGCEAAARYFGGRRKVEAQLAERVLDELLARDIRTADAYEGYLALLKQQGIAGQGQAKRRHVIDVLHHYHETRMVLSHLENQHPGNRPGRDFLAGLRENLQQLVPERFILLYDDERLGHLLRYLKALSIRAERGIVNLEKDRAKNDQLEPFARKLHTMAEGLEKHAALEKRQALEELFWMIEEFKISIFAQEIKTAGPVSAKRIGQQIAQIEAMP